MGRGASHRVVSSLAQRFEIREEVGDLLGREVAEQMLWHPHEFRVGASVVPCIRIAMPMPAVEVEQLRFELPRQTFLLVVLENPLLSSPRPGGMHAGVAAGHADAFDGRISRGPWMPLGKFIPQAFRNSGGFRLVDIRRLVLAQAPADHESCIQPSISPDHFNGCRGSRDAGELHVAGDQRGVERFREGEIGGVVRCAVDAHLPDPVEQNVVGIPADPQSAMIFDRLPGTRVRELTGHDESTKHVRHFQIEDVGSRDGFARA